MTTFDPILGAGVIPALKQFVTVTKLHPILVNFTAALIPVSVFSDVIGRVRKLEAFRQTAWWTLLYATLITPFTAITGWLFWMDDDVGVTGMTIHKWLGTGFVFLLFGLCAWRWNIHRRKQWPNVAYLVVGFILVVVVAYQGHLGGTQVFSDM